MSGRRFELILKFLHLNNGQEQPSTNSVNYDKLYKLRPVLDKIIKNFKQAYIPNQQLSVDESMIGFKGRLSWVQYMPKKPTKWGMKAWVLADSTNGYAYNWKLYTGKEGVKSGKGLAHRVVLNLVEDLAGKGYNIFMDNFYSSPALYHDLYNKGFGACGTVRIDRKGLSDTFKTKRLKKGEIYSEKTSEGMLCLKWKDKREVCMLSTLHDDSVIEKRRHARETTDGTEIIKKPRVIEEYNKFLGGADLSDQMILYYGYAHRSKKWWKRAFFHLIDLCITNANVLYNITATKILTQFDFRLEIATGLLDGFHRRTQQRYISPHTDIPLRLTQRPFPEPITSDKQYGGRPQCEVCRSRKKKRSQTQYQCKCCKVPLHIYPCLEIFHTQLRYDSQ